jgi:hypothetical protein
MDDGVLPTIFDIDRVGDVRAKVRGRMRQHDAQ